MIKNEKQYAITKKKRDEFSKTLESLLNTDNDDLFNKIMIDSITSQIETFDNELFEFEKLKEKPNIIISPIEKLPELLIKARIIRGLSHNDLAKKAGLIEQQIQRYESNNYESANFERILNIAKSMDIHFEDTKVFLNNDIIPVSGYDPCFIKQATNKLQSKKSLLTV